MSIAGIRDALKSTLGNVSALKHVYDTAPEAVNELPAAIILPVSGVYDDSRGNMEHRFQLTVLVAISPGHAAAQDTLDGMMAESGSGSIKAALENTTYLNTGSFYSHGDDLRVTGYSRYGGIEYAGAQYIGVIFDITIWT